MKQIVLVVLLVARTAFPCAPAPPQGKEVQIADEEAVILWEPLTQTETFIRRATFVSTAQSFGFLVPTPTLPVLADVPDDLGAERRAIAPRQVEETSGFELDPTPLALTCMGGGMKGAAMDDARAVRVMQTAHVAGYDATTLAADDPAALAAWLGQHGYATTPELTAWLARYTETHWVITAFVVASDEKAEHYDVSTRNVKMTFKTDRPFYPYREPASAKSAPQRLLRVWMFAPERMTGTIGTAPWPGTTLWSGNYHAAPGETIGRDAHLTVFEDTSSPRPGTDELYFARSADQKDVEQPPIVHTRKHWVPLPLDLLALVVIVVIVVVRRRKISR